VTGRSLTTDSILSEGTAVSRESIISMSSKLLNMESELDKTLRDLEGAGSGGGGARGGSGQRQHSKSPHHSKSPSASRRYSSHRTSTAKGGRRSGSFDPLASSRRSGSIDPAARDKEDPKVRELLERVDHLEKENQLLDSKYTQQRKRLNLVKRERPDDMRARARVCSKCCM